MTSCESNNPNAIEVDGICFETIVSERMYRLPKYGEETPVQFGVRITNNSSTSYRFELPLVTPKILNPHGKPMQMNFAQNHTRFAEESDIPLIISGESLKFVMNAKFRWYSRDCIQLTGYIFYGGIWSFYNFKPSKYQIRLTYEQPLHTRKMNLQTGFTKIDGFWTGKIATLFVKLRLR